MLAPADECRHGSASVVAGRAAALLVVNASRKAHLAGHFFERLEVGPIRIDERVGLKRCRNAEPEEHGQHAGRRIARGGPRIANEHFLEER